MPGPAKNRPFDLLDLDRVLRGADLITRHESGYENHHEDMISATYYARRTGLNRSRFYEFRRNGLTHRMADELACAFDLHPAVVWPHFYDDLEASAS